MGNSNINCARGVYRKIFDEKTYDLYILNGELQDGYYNCIYMNNRGGFSPDWDVCSELLMHCVVVETSDAKRLIQECLDVAKERIMEYVVE